MITALKQLIFPEFRPGAALRPRHSGGTDGVSLRWLGTAGFALEYAGETLLIDPYLTRSSLSELVFTALRPDEAAVRAQLPERAQAVLCGHSHFDHLLDAPLAAELTGAKLVGSRTTLAFGRAHGLPEAQMLDVGPLGAELEFPPFSVTFVPSRHARLLLGHVPFPGAVTRADESALRPWSYRMGGAFGLFIRVGGLSIYHNGSADLVDAELAGRRADVLLVGLAGRRYTPRYLERLLGLLEPRWLVPAHHDAFFSSLDLGVRLLPGIDFDGFVSEAARLSRARVLAPFYGETVWLAPDGKEGGLLL